MPRGELELEVSKSSQQGRRYIAISYRIILQLSHANIDPFHSYNLRPAPSEHSSRSNPSCSEVVAMCRSCRKVICRGKPGKKWSNSSTVRWYSWVHSISLESSRFNDFNACINGSLQDKLSFSSRPSAYYCTASVKARTCHLFSH